MSKRQSTLEAVLQSGLVTPEHLIEAFHALLDANAPSSLLRTLSDTAERRGVSLESGPSPYTP